MERLRSLIKSFLRTMVVLGLALQIAGCGSQVPAHINTDQTYIKRHATTTANKQSTLPPSPQGDTTSVADGLSIKASYSCSYSSGRSNIVLAHSDTSNIDSKTMVDVNNYINEIWGPGFTNGDMLPALPLSLQNVLQFVSGTQNDLSGVADQNQSSACHYVLNITNQSQSNILLSKAVFQLTSVPDVNTFHYTLISPCYQKVPCEPWGGGGSTLTANITLSNGTTNTSFTGKLSGGDSTTESTVGNDNPLVLQPNVTIPLNISFRSVGTVGNSIYSGVLELLLWLPDVNGQQTLKLPPIRLAFANINQFSCLELRPSGFVPVPLTTECI